MFELLKSAFDFNRDGKTSFGEIIGGIIFFGFLFVSVIWVASIELALFENVFPDNIVNRYWGLTLFSVGVLFWITIFLIYAKGIVQRILSALMIFESLIATLVAVLTETLIGGQQLIQLTETKWVYMAAVVIVAVQTFVQLVAFTIFKVTDPKIIKKMIENNQEDRIEALAMKKLDDKLDKVADGWAETEAQEQFYGVMEKRGHGSGKTGGGGGNKTSKKHQRDTVLTREFVGHTNQNGQYEGHDRDF